MGRVGRVRLSGRRETLANEQADYEELQKGINKLDQLFNGNDDYSGIKLFLNDTINNPLWKL